MQGLHFRPSLQLQRVDAIAEILLAEIQVVGIPIVHPGDLVAGRVSHEVQEEGVFIHETRISIEDRHLMGFVEFAMRVALLNQVAQDSLVASMIPESFWFVLESKSIPILKKLASPRVVFRKNNSRVIGRCSSGQIARNM